MDSLQTDLRTSYPLLNIQIIGVNEAGHESANSLMTEGRVLPWIQDVDANANQQSDLWYDSWNVEFRDVIVLGGANENVGVYNLTVNSLGVSANYAALRQLLVDAAMAVQKPWQNRVVRFDVNGDGQVAPLDVLAIINSLNRDGSRKLPPPTQNELRPPYYDTDGDGFIAPFDVLQAVNHLNRIAGGGEGEYVGAESAELATAELPLVNATSVVDNSPSTGDYGQVRAQTGKGALLESSESGRAFRDLPPVGRGEAESPFAWPAAAGSARDVGVADAIVARVSLEAPLEQDLAAELVSETLLAGLIDPSSADVLFAGEGIDRGYRE